MQIQVSGGNKATLYVAEQIPFCQAEILADGEVLAATGENFCGAWLRQREQKVMRYAPQRGFMESWDMTRQEEVLPLATLPLQLTYLDRIVPMPEDILWHMDAPALWGTFRVQEDAPIRSVYYNDYEDLVQGIFPDSQLEKGKQTLESFEPYTLRYLYLYVVEGEIRIEDLYVRDFGYPMSQILSYSCKDPELSPIYEAARQTLHQSVVDIYMDTPGRERSGSTRILPAVSATDLAHSWVESSGRWKQSTTTPTHNPFWRDILESTKTETLVIHKNTLIRRSLQ